MTTVVHGLDELASGLQTEFDKLRGAEVKKALRVAAYAGAAKARDLVRARAPVRSHKGGDHPPGLLKKSIVAGSQRAQGGTLAEAGVYIKGAAYYWRYLELGTVNMVAKPFIRPAFDAGENAIGEAIATRLGAAIEEALARR